LWAREPAKGKTPMARNAPPGDGQRKGMVKKRSQLKTKIMGEEHFTKRDRTSGQFMDQKADDKKFKGVRKEKPAVKKTMKKATRKKK
jgi:hypothetical protein